MKNSTIKDEIIDFMTETYGTQPDSPWKKYPENLVFRHEDTKKWYALVMPVTYGHLSHLLPAPSFSDLCDDPEKYFDSDLYHDPSEKLDIINLKADPVMMGSFLQSPGVIRAYHMNKDNWISVLLDGSAPIETIKLLIEMSFELTSKKKASTSKKAPVRITQWLIPANPKYYDIETAVRERTDDIFTWKQSSNIRPGDTVYMYVGAPVSAIRYKFKAVETDIPYVRTHTPVKLKKIMKLQLTKIYDRPPIDRQVLAAHNVLYIRGPRSMPHSLIAEIEELYHEV